MFFGLEFFPPLLFIILYEVQVSFQEPPPSWWSQFDDSMGLFQVEENRLKLLGTKWITPKTHMIFLDYIVHRVKIQSPDREARGSWPEPPISPHLLLILGLQITSTCHSDLPLLLPPPVVLFTSGSLMTLASVCSVTDLLYWPFPIPLQHFQSLALMTASFLSPWQSRYGKIFLRWCSFFSQF